jgi:CHAD domain-containing protein
MTTPEQAQGITFSDWGYLAIAKHFKKTIKHESAVLEDQDPEELHQMRVGMRRLRSALVGFENALIFPEYISQKKVGKIASILGNLRDIDVLLDTLTNVYQPILPETEQKILNMVIKSLTKNRKHHYLEVEKTLHDQNYKKLKKEFKKWLKSPQYSPIGGIQIRKILSDLLLPQISQFLLHQGWLVGTYFVENSLQIRENLNQLEVENLLASEGDQLHDLRKEAKKLRYNLELFTQFYDENFQKYINQVKEIQTILGDLQDIFVLGDFLEDIFGPELDEKLPSLLNELAKIRYQKWQQWQILQTYFLKTSNRNNWREIIINHTENVTVSAIAYAPISENMG